jgi:CelD/BcsL family acetyltransferase involved in cellulose biosynthesis
MTRFKLIKWRELGSDERAALTAFRCADPRLRSPYFDPAFLDLVDATRCDLEALVAEEGGRPRAFLPLHRNGLGEACPAAGPLSDWHGFIAAPCFAPDTAQALAQVGLSALRFDSALAGTGLAGGVERTAYRLDLACGFEAYETRRRAQSGKAWRSLASRQRRLVEAGRKVELTADDRSPETLHTLLAWKSAQYRRTGQFDLFTRPWIVRLAEALAETREPGFRGRVSSLWIDGRLAAAHLGMQSGGVLHYWFPAFDPALSEHAPGLLLLTGLARRAADLGIREIDLGKGDYRFKREFADPGPTALEGVAVAANVQGRLQAAARGLAQAWAKAPLGLAARLPDKVSRRVRRDLGYITPDWRRG